MKEPAGARIEVNAQNVHNTEFAVTVYYDDGHIERKVSGWPINSAVPEAKKWAARLGLPTFCSQYKVEKVWEVAT